MKTLGIPISLKALVVCLCVAAIAAGGAYGVGKSLTPVYQSTSTIRVTAHQQGGLNDPVITASNDLAAEYAQLVSSDQIRALTAKALGVTVASINGKLSGSTVNAQNLLQVTATADSASAAVARAAAAGRVVHTYINALVQQQSIQYLASVHRGVSNDMRKQSVIGISPVGVPGEQLAAQLANGRAQVVGEAVRDAASNQPVLQLIDLGTGASETSPQPKLYAVVALIIALVLTLRLAFVLEHAKPD
jgi:capsular polysaccharide biosynthesis protein